MKIFIIIIMQNAYILKIILWHLSAVCLEISYDETFVQNAK